MSGSIRPAFFVVVIVGGFLVVIDGRVGIFDLKFELGMPELARVHPGCFRNCFNVRLAMPFSCLANCSWTAEM